MWSWHYVPTYDIIIIPTNSVTVYNAIAAGYMKWVWDRLASRYFTLRIATFLMAPSIVSGHVKLGQSHVYCLCGCVLGLVEVNYYCNLSLK